MWRCLELASHGLGHVAPNPMVGAVVVHDDRIIGEGYHRAFGGPHAEVHAIQDVKNQALLSESTLYVNLEPCSHFGKTPPCADLILEKRIPRVVVCNVDPNPEVSGRGIKRLRETGVEVHTGILEAEGAHLNRRFFTFHKWRRPFIILKWAQSTDGFMDARRSKDEKGIKWISHPATKKLVHQWRSQEQAILVGAGTLRTDDPTLTVREVYGKSPLRIVLSESGAIPPDATLMKDGHPTWIVSRKAGESIDTLKWILETDPERSLIEIALKEMHTAGISSVFVEGGARTLQGIMDTGRWDEARVITSDVHIGAGLAAPVLPFAPARSYTYGADTIHEYFNT